MRLPFPILFASALTALWASCAGATANPSPAVPASPTGPVVVLGRLTALEGTWQEVTSAPASNLADGTVTTTLTWTLNNGNFTGSQLNHYSGGRANEAWDQTGTVAYLTGDNTVFIHMIQERKDSGSYGAIDRSYYFRNVLVDGVWHPSVLLRIGSGQGFSGEWDYPQDGKNKWRLQVDPNPGQLLMTQYDIDGTGAARSPTGITAVVTSYAWDGQVLTEGGTYRTPWRLLANDLIETPLGSSTRTPVFHRP